MKRYTISFLIFCAWFYVFKMTPVRYSSSEITCGTVNSPERRTYILASEDARKGIIAFEANCARCHNSQLEKKGTGPALYGMSQRIPGGDWLYRWIRNPSKMITDGDPYAVKIWNENGKAAMDHFPNLADSTIDAIVAWIDGY
ncbi:MAG: cytochrome c [Bacteroidetes bacterium]|nr:cytochrome c [Bacteroidota bacterium]